MKKHKITKKGLIKASVAFVILLVAIFGTLLFLTSPVSSDLKKAIGIKSNAPTFAFNEQTANGWWAAENYNSKENVEKDYKGEQSPDKLSVASRNIFQSRDTTVDHCFVMYAYYDYSADVDAMEKKRGDDASHSSGLIYTEQNPETLSMDTPEGTKSYVLHEYAITGTGSEQMQRGMSWGYIRLANGYISINGICPEGNQLSGAVSGMKSISLVK